MALNFWRPTHSRVVVDPGNKVTASQKSEWGPPTPTIKGGYYICISVSRPAFIRGSCIMYDILFIQFLALLDCPSGSQLSLHLMRNFFQILVVASRGAYARDFFLILRIFFVNVRSGGGVGWATVKSTLYTLNTYP